MPYKVTKQQGSWAITGTVNRFRVRRRYLGLARTDVTVMAAEFTRIAAMGTHPLEAAQVAEAGAITFKEIAEAWQADGHHLHGIKEAIRQFGTWEVTSIKPKDVRSWAKERWHGRTPSMNRCGIAPVRAAINWASLNYDGVSSIKISGFHEPKMKRSAAPAEWLGAFQEQAWSMGPKYLGLAELMEFEKMTAARTSECHQFTWDMMNFQQLTVFLPKTKNGKPREFPIPLKMVEGLMALQAAQGHIREFKETPEGVKVHHHTVPRLTCGKVFPFVSKEYIWKLCKDVCKAGGIEYIQPHRQGRHTYATDMHNIHSWSANDIAESGGWEDIGLVQRTYIHSDKTSRDATSLMESAGGQRKGRLTAVSGGGRRTPN